jgi:hypothetical protein
MKIKNKIAFTVFGIGFGLLSGCTWDKVEPEVCFESEVLPIFITYCSTNGCHNSVDREDGIDLSNYLGIMQEVTPKHVAGSEVVEVMNESGEDHMPPNGSPQPSQAQIATIKAWIKSGADNTTNCSTVSCDTAAVVSFGVDIQPLMETYCVGCHSGGNASGGVNLSTYAALTPLAATGRLQGAMAGDPQYAAMPPSGNLLPTCYVDKINKWVAAGSPDN